MFGIFKNRIPKDPSKIRKWAEKDYKEKQRIGYKETQLIQTLSNSLLYGISRFGAPEKEFVNDPLYYIADDLAIFEWACFVYYLIGNWHSNDNLHKNQIEIFQFLINDMINKFEDIAGFKNLKQIVDNRFKIYNIVGEEDKGTFFKNRAESPWMSRLEELIVESTSKGELAPYEIDDTILIYDAFKRLSINTALTASIVYILPVFFDNMEKFYAMIDSEV
ncbi:MAG: hypothetical protein ABR969_04395 [Sedimentisphaerales bacterium]